MEQLRYEYSQTLLFFKKKVEMRSLASCSFNFTFSFMQAAKKLYESLLTDSVNTTALAHIQVRNCWSHIHILGG